MPSTLTRVGRFRAAPYAWSLTPSSSSEAVGLRLSYMCTSEWDEQVGEWRGLEPPWPTVEGAVWICGRDGKPNQRAVRDLFYALKWNGDPLVFADLKSWRPPPCEITVEAEEYQGNLRYKVNRIDELGAKESGRIVAERLAKYHGAGIRRSIASLAAQREAAGLDQAPAPDREADEAPPQGEVPRPMGGEEIPF